MTRLITTVPEVRAARSAPRAVVMTMGALHEGHMALVDLARRQVGDSGQVVVTIFVNPLQFGPSEDFDRYPRQLEQDMALCRERGVDVVFAPGVEQMYPLGAARTTVEPGDSAQILEGVQRPGHFAGVLTVVLKLLQMTQPDAAIFGEKDYQQLTLIRQMAVDLDLDVEVVGAPTQRDTDGVAMSSRNAYLTPEERESAAAIPSALREAQSAAEAGGTCTQVLQAAEQQLSKLEIDYLELRTPDLNLLTDEPEPGTVGRLLVAVRLGSTRLLDNCEIRWA